VACGDKEATSLEEQAQSIDKLLICPVCPAETIDQSQVPLAKDMQLFVRERLAQGWTKQQILDYFSAPERYGSRVLAEPPKSGASLTVWIVPPAIVLIGALIVFLVIRSMSSPRTYVPDESVPTDEELAPYLARVDAELAARTEAPPGRMNQESGSTASDSGLSHG
jgi:cytochrome c-type biogenesis protein CcmH